VKLNTKPLQDIEIGIPVLADKQVLFARVVSKEIKPSKQKVGSETLHVEFKIVDPTVVKKDGTEIPNRGNLNYTFYIGLTPGPKYDPNEKLKELAVALGVEDSKSDFELDDIVPGTFCKVVMKFEAASGQYPDRNSINGIRPIKASDNFDSESVPNF
jgi:hypothetical protein